MDQTPDFAVLLKGIAWQAFPAPNSDETPRLPVGIATALSAVMQVE
jgi:hypothetical protein